MHFPSLTEHQLLVFWVDMAVIVAVAIGVGRLARLLGQPPVVGELLAGILLGPSVLGRAWPGGFHWLFGQGTLQAGLVNAVGWLGVAMLLVLTGFETDLAIVRRVGRAAGMVALFGLALPFASGLAVGYSMPHTFAGAHTHRIMFVAFIGVGLSISSLPVIAKILQELGLMRRNFGQATVAVGMVNDLVGWLALGVISGLAESGRFSAGRLAFTGGVTAALLVVAFTIGQRGTNRLLRAVRGRSDSPVDALAVNVIVVLIAAVVAEAIHIEAVLGAYIAGIVLGRSPAQQESVRRNIESITLAVLAPVFFVIAGLRVDISLLARPTVLLWAAVVLVVAVASKFIGALLGARIGGLVTREGMALGAGLNARGAVEVVIATVGLSLGVLSDSAYTIIVLMAVATSVMAPPLLRAIVGDWRGTHEERERLDREEQLDRNLLVRPGRLLLPSRGRANSIVAAQVAHFAWPPETGVTVLSVGDEQSSEDLSPVATVFHERNVEFRRAPTDEALATILSEARLGYSAIAVGASDNPGAGRILSSVVDDLLLQSPVPVVVVRRARDQRTRTPPAFARALLPLTGTPASRAAQEVAFGLAAQLGTEVVAMHVINRSDVEPSAASAARRGAHPGSDPVARAAVGVIEKARDVAAELDIQLRSAVRTGLSTAEEILAAAEEAEADLIVLGATVRPLEGRPFLGHNVEHVLDAARPTVVVVTMPGFDDTATARGAEV